MTEALRGNTKHRALNPKQRQNTHDQMTKTCRIEIFVFRVWSEATLGFNPCLNYAQLFKMLHIRTADMEWVNRA